jgi:hypothetical protein
VKTPVVMDVWVELPVAGVILIWGLCLFAYEPTQKPAMSGNKEDRLTTLRAERR